MHFCFFVWGAIKTPGFLQTGRVFFWLSQQVPVVLLVFFQHLELCRQLAGIIAQEHIAPLGQGAGIDHDGTAHAIHSSCLVYMAAQADIRLGLFKKFTHRRRADMNAAGDDVAGGVLGRIMGHEYAVRVIARLLPAGFKPCLKGGFGKFAGRAERRERGSANTKNGGIGREFAGYRVEVPAFLTEPLVHLGAVHISYLRENH